jgi:hypothetical protein
VRTSIKVRITRRRRCAAGFYLVAGTNRFWFPTKRKAIAELSRTLSLLTFAIEPAPPPPKPKASSWLSP